MQTTGKMADPLHTKSFHETVRARRSFRQFKSDPVPEAVIEQILNDAQFAPSNCNTQPWSTHIVSGTTRNILSDALHAAYEADLLSPDFSWNEADYPDEFTTRRREHGRIYYENLGVARADTEGRRRAGALNFSFFNAPHVAFVFMPVVGDSVRIASDIGMYSQTFLLALAARGVGGIPQTVLGLYAETIRQTLGVAADLKLLFGISFGFADEEAAANRSRTGRDPLQASVIFHV